MFCERRELNGVRNLKRKICTKCNIEKDISEFSKARNRADGYQTWCKSCYKIYRDTHDVNSRKEYHHNYYKENAIILREKHKIYYSTENGYKRKWVSTSLNSHRRRGYDVRISNQQLYDFIQDKYTCAYCGIVLKWESNGGFVDDSPTVDRVDNENYIDMNNIQIICTKCNGTKRNRTHKEFVEYCNNIVQIFG